MTSVDDAYANLRALADSVEKADLSAYNFINDIGAKTLLIAAAGDLEKRLCGALIDRYNRHLLPQHLVDFIQRQALERKFHSLFDWNNSKTNKFLALFGDLKMNALRKTLDEEPYSGQEKDFMYIGKTRNEIVHIGITSVSLQNTKEEIYEKYRSALAYVNFISLNV